MSTTLTVYQIPKDARIGADGIRPGFGRQLGPIPQGQYTEHQARGRYDGQICLIRLGDADGAIDSHYYWVHESDVAQYAQGFVPADHNLPEEGKCFLGLNFTDEQWQVVQQAIGPTDNPEAALTRICQEWYRQKTRYTITNEPAYG